jgi:hypothetical protein
MIARMRDLFDDGLFKWLTAGYRTDDFASRLDQMAYDLRVHPFAAIWGDITRGIEESKSSRSLSFSSRAWFLLDDLAALDSAKGDPAYPSLIEKLKGRKQFFSTLYEAQTYAQYHQLGYDVSIVPASPTPSIRAPDFKLSLSGGETVFIECKSMLDDVEEEQQIWRDIRTRIATALTKHSDSVGLRIVANRRIRQKDKKQVLQTFYRLLREFPNTSHTLSDAVKMSIKAIDDPTIALSEPCTFPRKRHEQGWAEATATEGNLVHAWTIQSIPFVEVDQTDRILRLIRQAQLPHDGLGVLHLQLPYQDPYHFFEVLSAARPKVEDILSRRRHISAVLLTGRFMNTDMKDGGDIMSRHIAVLPNFAIQTLPANFKLPGHRSLEVMSEPKDMDLALGAINDFELTPSGTMTIEFSLNERLDEQPGRFLMSYCSTDGRKQLGVWQSYNNFFRIDIIHDAFGRRSLKQKFDFLAPGILHKLMFTWSEEGITCMVNRFAIYRSQEGYDPRIGIIS